MGLEKDGFHFLVRKKAAFFVDGGILELYLFCTKCGMDTEQRYLGSSLNPPRIVTRCQGCKQTNFTDSKKVDDENRKIRQNARNARLACKDEKNKAPIQMPTYVNVP